MIGLVPALAGAENDTEMFPDPAAVPFIVGAPGAIRTQLPPTVPVPFKRKDAVPAQPAVITTWVGVAFPSVNGAMATPLTYSGDINE